MATLGKSRQASTTYLGTQSIVNSAAIQGLLVAILCGVLGYLTLVFQPGNHLLGVISIVALPLICGLILTRNLSYALTLTWINEIFIGGNGRWLVLGTFSGRWLLLIVVVGVWVLSQLGSRSTQHRTSAGHDSKAVFWILLLSIYLPAWLVFYSTVIRSTPLSEALGDVDFLIALLVYFPVRDLFRAHRDIVVGWMLGSSLVLVVVLLSMSMGPLSLRDTLVRTLISENQRVGVVSSGISRIGMVHVVLLFFPIFLSIFSTIASSSSFVTRIRWLLFGLVVLLPMSVTYLRGPLLGGAIVLLIFTVAALTKSEFGRIKTRRIILLLPVIVVIVTVVMLTVVPEESISKFRVGPQGISSWVSLKRAEQSYFALSAFLEEPLLGKGAGVPLRRHSIFADYFNTLDMELGYHKLLYRFGAIAFGLILVPVLWFLSEPFRFFGSRSIRVNMRDEAIALASLAAVLGVLISGAFNPYLTTPFTPLLISIYLSAKGIMLEQS